MEIFRPYRFDKRLFFSTLILITLGLVMVFSASGVAAAEKYNQPFYFLIHQLIGAATGLIVIVIILSIRKPFYQHPVFIFGLLLLTLGLLFLCFMMPSFAKTNRWVILFGLRFQPSELAKVSLVLFLAWYLDRRKEKIQELSVLLVPSGVVFLFVLVILKEPDFGTALLTFALCAILLFIGGVRLKYFAYLGLLSLPLFAYYVFSAGYRLDRILAFFSPDKNLQTLNFQVAQSKIALGAGGLLGVSIGESAQKMFFLPCPHTDFIFAVIGEELGLLGTLATLVLFIILIWRGIVISMKAPNLFSQLAAAGLTLLIAIQALLNITVVLGLGPAKGVPLPLLSFGRSSLITTLFAIGILLHISQRKEINRSFG
jgi:cell division protein FtsW